MYYWDWKVEFFYNSTVELPKIPGELAVATVHRGERSLKLEVEVGKKRPDIGKIQVRWIGCPHEGEKWERIVQIIRELEQD